jgi:hypothetical protein
MFAEATEPGRRSSADRASRRNARTCAPGADPDDALAAACADVPAFVRSAVVLVAEQLAIARTGAGTDDDFRPLERCALRCVLADGEPFAACAFQTAEHQVIVQRLADPRLVVVAQTTRDCNLALAISAVRVASAHLATTLDLELLES